MLALLLLYVCACTAHTCIHHKIGNHPEDAMIIKKTSHSAHALQNTARKNMRITISTLDLDNPKQYCTAVGESKPDFTGGTLPCSESDIFTPAKKAQILNVLLPFAVNYAQSALKVTPIDDGISLNEGTCRAGITIPPAHLSDAGAPNADYLLYVSAGAISGGSTLAWGKYCGFETSGRPVVGMINFNPAFLGTSDSDMAAQKTALHELFHALGFTDTWAIRPSKLRPDQTNVAITSVSLRGKTVKIISTPEVIRTSREYFGCPTMAGLELEDGGGEGTVLSHWEKRVAMDEIMTGLATAGELSRSVSPMTLAFFKDSGLYDVDYAMADSRTFAKGAGCGFINEKCNTVAGGNGKQWCFDPMPTEMCTPDRISIGTCNMKDFPTDLPVPFQYNNPKKAGRLELVDYCPFIEGMAGTQCINVKMAPDTKMGQTYALESRCFDTTDPDGSTTNGGLLASTESSTKFTSLGQRCLRTLCTNNMLQIGVGPTATGAWVNCPADGSAAVVDAPAGWKGKIKCPPAAEICAGAVPQVPGVAPVTTAKPVPVITSGPQAPGSQAPGSQAPGPQAPGPQAPGPQAPGSQAPGPQAPFSTDEPPAPTDYAEEGTSEDLCNDAFTTVLKACPGLAFLKDVDESPSKAQLNSICPCLTDAAVQKNEVEYFSIFFFCDQSISLAFSILENLMCVQPVNKNKYCGEEFANANATLRLINNFLKSDTAMMDPKLLTQTTFTNLCTECFDLFLVGAYTIFGDLTAQILSPTCDEECQKNAEEAAHDLTTLAYAQVMCIANDNTDLAKTNPFCFPYVYNTLYTIGKDCSVQKTESACKHQRGECEWWETKCVPIYQVPVTKTGDIQMPPTALLDKFCSNSCFFTTQFALLAIGAMQSEIENFEEYSVNPDRRRLRRRRNNKFRTARRARRGMKTLQTGAGSHDGAHGADEEEFTPEEYETQTEDLEAVAQYMCLSNSKGRCFQLYGSLKDPAACAKDIASWGTVAPTCADTGCAAAYKADVDSLGCCYGVVADMIEMADPMFEDFDNEKGIAKACNVTIEKACDPFASAPVPATAKVSGTCAWLLSNTTNTVQLKNDTAKALGIPPASLKDFKVTASDGSQCTAAKNRVHQRRAKTLQAQAGLRAGFSVVARDAETANRIAATAAAKPITIPAVQKEATQVTAVKKNTEIAKVAPTLAPKTLSVKKAGAARLALSAVVVFFAMTFLL